MTTIEWTEQTWNPVVGCSVTSPGCKNCYAMRMAHRLGANPATPHYAGLTQMSKGGPVWAGRVTTAPDHIWEAPLRRRKPTTYFVNSMGDLFHPKVTDAQIVRVFAIMALCPQHRFQMLTKQPARMRDWMRAHASDPEGGWDNVWLGVSVEDQTRANERIPILLDTPAAVRFISAEPLLGPVDLLNAIGLGKRLKNEMDWVIVGGESGPASRPMNPAWAQQIRDDCAAAGVPFFFKQWGRFQPADDGQSMIRGRDPKTLDGVVHAAMPQIIDLACG